MAAGQQTTVAVLFGLAYDPDVRVRRMTQSLSAAGWQVEIVAWDRELKRPTLDQDGEVRVVRVHVRSGRGLGLRQLVYLPRAGLEMIRHLRRTKPAVVHAVDLPMLMVALVGLPFLGRPRPRLVYDAAEIYGLMVAHKFPAPVLAVIRMLERLLPRAADVTIAPGESRAQYFRQRGIQSIVVPNWIDPPEKRMERSVARGELGLSQNVFCLAYVGAILGSRDLETLLEYARAHPDDAVVIAGRGDRVAWLRDAAETIPNVQFLGWLTDPSLPLAAADALYYSLRPEHPYSAFPAPNNLYVAIAYGLPLIYRRQGELRIMGDEHEIGVPFTDLASMDAAVDQLRDPAVRRRIEGVLGDLRRRHSWSDAVRALLEVYPRSRRDERGPSR